MVSKLILQAHWCCTRKKVEQYKYYLRTKCRLTFWCLEAAEMNGLHIINQSWYFSSSLCFLLLCNFVGLQDWSGNWHTCRSRLCWFIIARTIGVRWSSAFFWTLTHLLHAPYGLPDYERNKLLKHRKLYKCLRSKNCVQDHLAKAIISEKYQTFHINWISIEYQSNFIWSLSRHFPIGFPWRELITTWSSVRRESYYIDIYIANTCIMYIRNKDKYVAVPVLCAFSMSGKRHSETVSTTSGQLVVWHHQRGSNSCGCNARNEQTQSSKFPKQLYATLVCI